LTVILWEKYMTVKGQRPDMKSANIITLIRIAIVPVFMVIYLIEIPYHEIIAFTLFLLASLTDKLDGYIARKYNQISDFGKFIDPLADKILITAALVMLSEAGIIPSWVVVLIITREFVVTGLRTVAMSAGRVIAASSWGKAKMVVQVITVSFLLTPLRSMTLGPIAIGGVLIGIMTLVTIWSGADYLILNRDLFRKENSED
jgi:CDP-diacylglycerol--glycerol-3-phosphate 3-phosphatidyltransferase